jgi:large subunit ribosomal protein L15
MPDYLSKLKPPSGSRKKGMRVGRGIGSTLGKTSGRGQKGYGSRSGSRRRWGYEGGQMPLQRRIPKRGFVNPFPRQYTVINVRDIERWGLKEISPQVLVEGRLVKKLGRDGLRVLGHGELKRAVTVKAHHISAQAAEKISGAGGKPIVIRPPEEAEAPSTGSGERKAGARKKPEVDGE